MVPLLCALLSGLFVQSVSANGGTIRVGNQRVGPHDLTVFTDPTPVRVGTCDVSVAVARAGGSDLVPDAEVQISASPVARPQERTTYRATHELATNKLFYAAHVPLSSAGRWRVEVAVRSNAGEGTTSFEVDVEEAGLFDNPALVLAALLVPLAPAAWLLTRATRRQRR